MQTLKTTVATMLIGLLAPGAYAEIARTASGHPDLSGTYDVSTLTPNVATGFGNGRRRISKRTANRRTFT